VEPVEDRMRGWIHVKFYIASLCRKEHTLLAPWIEKLDGYGSEVHNSTSFTNAKPHAAG
jgi:hypothetical protein